MRLSFVDLRQGSAILPSPERSHEPVRIAVVMSEVFIRRLTAGLSPFVRHNFDFRILSIHRPREELNELLTGFEPSGMITEWLPDITDFLLELGYPTVIADSDRVYPGCVSVDVDDREVGREAARRFLMAGYRQFACLSNDLPYAGQRRDGFEAELAANGLEAYRFREPEPRDRRYLEDVREPGIDLVSWLAGLPKPIGVFAVHDPLGRHRCEACLSAGLRVPDDVAVIGANNDSLVAELSFPSLSSVQIPWRRIGTVVGEAMADLWRGKRPVEQPILIPPSGVEVRQSSDRFRVEDSMLRRALAWLDRHHREPVGVADLCGRLRVSRRSLERRFREYLRRTPYQMLTEMRVATARRLLVETNEPMPVVAELSGFGDAERLAVVFRRATGRRPSDFRRRAGNQGGRLSPAAVRSEWPSDAETSIRRG